jgi:hypothetical protein
MKKGQEINITANDQAIIRLSHVNILYGVFKKWKMFSIYKGKTIIKNTMGMTKIVKKIIIITLNDFY